MSELSSQTLHVVNKELAATLNEARVALENFAEHPESLGLMEQCSERLHQAHGVLRVVEVYGAALLAEEMEQVTRYIINTAKDNKNQSEGLDALMRAMVQLPAYLERVLGGGRDLALVLLPLLNDLRAVRGSALLSEGTLLVLNLKSDQQSAPQTSPDGEPPLSLVQWARRLRPRFQLGLLGWIRGERVQQNLEILARVVEKLEQVSTGQTIFQLWWVTGALIEALREGGLQEGATLKRLMGLADREIKRLYTLGEDRYTEEPALDLLNNLLYYVARSTSAGPKVSAVRSSFKLGELLPVDASVEQARANLSAPSIKLMRTVGAAIKEDLTKVKDVLDIFVRKGSTQTSELAPQLELLKKISDTLGVLGLGGLRSTVQAEIQNLQKLIDQGAQVNDAALVQMAAVLINVEDTLDDQLVRLVMPEAAPTKGETSEDQDGGESQSDDDSDYRQVSGAVLRECIVNLARVKEAVTQAVQRPNEAQGLDSVPQLLRGITSGLLMLGKTRAVEVVERIAHHLEDVLKPTNSRGSNAFSSHQYLDRLADAIVSLEYYMETVQSGRSDPWYMLDNAEGCMEVLADVQTAAMTAQLAGETVDPYARTVAIDRDNSPAAAAAAIEAVSVKQGPGTSFEATAAALTHPVVLTPDKQELDPEFIELFIEEAREEIESIQRQFPLWDQNPSDSEALVNVRRSFHTLKGSGRMVGAQLVGEYSWAVENLLNRIIEKTLMRTPGMMSLLRESVRVLPQLVEQLASGRVPEADIQTMVERAHAYAEGREPEQQPTPPAPDETVLPSGTTDAERKAAPPAAQLEQEAPNPTEPAQPAMDPDLHEIYARETSGHLTTLRDYLARSALLPPPVLVPEAVYRACHTLSGSSKMAEARHGIRIAEPLDHYVRKVFENGAGLSAEGLAVLQQSIEAIENVTSHIDESTNYFHTHEQLIKRIQRLDHELDEELAQRERDREQKPDSIVLEPMSSDQRAQDQIESALVESELTSAQDAPEQSEPFFDLWQDPPPAEPKSAVELSSQPAAEIPFPEPLIGASQEVQSQIPEPQIPEPQISGPQILEPLDPFAEIFDSSSVAAASEAVVEAEPEQEEPDPDFDPEIAAIFSEEATELLEVAERSLSGWNSSRGDKEQTFELKRVLHTLKGGARMAGLRAMGDLSHELETLVGQIEDGLLPADDRAYDVLQSSLDELSLMRDAINSRRSSATANKLIARIHALSRPEEQAPVEAPPVVAWQVETPAVEVEQEVPVFEAAPEPFAPIEASAPDIEAEVEAAVEIEVDFDIGGLLPEVAHEAIHADSTPQEPERYSDDMPSQEMAEIAVPEKLGFEDSAQPTPAQGSPAQESSVQESVPASSLAPIALPPGREPQFTPERQEMARVDAELLDTLLNNAGEVSIFRARMEQQVSSIDFNLVELTRTVTRLKEQLRNLEIETEAQILHRHEKEQPRREDFDPLEMDRYSSIQQFSRALAESANDVASIQGLLENLTREAQNLLMQQSRVVTELQNGLMRTRMVPFQRHVQRLSRIVRQVATETGKRAEMVVSGASGELDRQVLERMMPPFEHMLRNAVVHGIESPDERRAKGKSETGRIAVSLQREGAEVVIVVKDDGAGMNVKAIRDKAITLGMIDPRRTLSDEEAMQLVLEPGFSTASKITQAAGRGVGMDVVATEVKKLGGTLLIASTPEVGTTFTVRLPFTLAISQALIVRVDDELYALPLPTVEGVVRLPKATVIKHLEEEIPSFDYGGQKYHFQHLGAFISSGPSVMPEQDVSMSVVLIRAGDHSTALVTDELVGSREIVVKSVGPQISGIRGIAGATILGDGRIVLILDMGTLVRSDSRNRAASELQGRDRTDKRTFALVVDDSITVRRVTQRLLERNGMRVMTAKDGVDAVAILQDHLPDVILLDIEMPRMDGYEVASHVRNDERLKDVPIVMITSRVGEKHRARAIELGVDDYLGKPYQEAQLLDAIEPLVHKRETV